MQFHYRFRWTPLHKPRARKKPNFKLQESLRIREKQIHLQHTSPQMTLAWESPAG